MTKPKPKAELIITKVINEVHPFGYLNIRYYSNDARSWIIEHAKEFAESPELYQASIFEREMTLFVDPNYDIDEVKAYLESYLS